MQLLLNEAVGQLAVSSDSAVGGASVTLILLMASQQELRVHRLLLSFRGQWPHTGDLKWILWGRGGVGGCSVGKAQSD